MKAMERFLCQFWRKSLIPTFLDWKWNNSAMKHEANAWLSASFHWLSEKKNKDKLFLYFWPSDINWVRNWLSISSYQLIQTDIFHPFIITRKICLTADVASCSQFLRIYLKLQIASESQLNFARLWSRMVQLGLKRPGEVRTCRASKPLSQHSNQVLAPSPTPRNAALDWQSK